AKAIPYLAASGVPNDDGLQQRARGLRELRRSEPSGGAKFPVFQGAVRRTSYIRWIHSYAVVLTRSDPIQAAGAEIHEVRAPLHASTVHAAGDLARVPSVSLGVSPPHLRRAHEKGDQFACQEAAVRRYTPTHDDLHEAGADM